MYHMTLYDEIDISIVRIIDDFSLTIVNVR